MQALLREWCSHHTTTLRATVENQLGTVITHYTIPYVYVKLFGPKFD
ncbi:hypothetical protein RE6C_05937 [Rhodopirellula europaea 6C]|uniref:Uncharacterized protein n=1 Tax=Rhodopirellula europaea 6C TaxID=1263867 RepID=M2AUW2_9BACT|nr:hypothetical protein RE6C_05937 [Rhodopirellula europaea 6C]